MFKINFLFIALFLSLNMKLTVCKNLSRTQEKMDCGNKIRYGGVCLSEGELIAKVKSENISSINCGNQIYYDRVCMSTADLVAKIKARNSKLISDTPNIVTANYAVDERIKKKQFIQHSRSDKSTKTSTPIVYNNSVGEKQRRYR